MGGKKKTKWRKLPLEEFTKEIPEKQEEQPAANSCRADVAREENDFIPSFQGPPEIIQNYVEPYEYTDGIWYPTSCVVYNPGVFSNYMMPADTCYYYCTMPDAGQMQEYMPGPYPDFTPALPKDTVYLLLPTQTFRPTQPVQNIAPEWQARRRRRRYEGYAEYAVIPEKTSSPKNEEKDQSRVPGTQINSRRKSAQLNNFKRMSSFSETNFSDDVPLEQNQSSRKASDTKKNSTTAGNEKSISYINKEMDLDEPENDHGSKKIPEICGIHSKRKLPTKEKKTVNEKTNAVLVHNDLHQAVDLSNGNSSQLGEPLISRIASKAAKNNKKSEQFDTSDNKVLMTNEISEHIKNLNKPNKEMEKSAKASSLKAKEDHELKTAAKNEIRGENTQVSQISHSDTVNEPANVTLQKSDPSCGSHFCDNEHFDKESNLKSKSLSSQRSTQNLLISEALQKEIEIDLRNLEGSYKASQTDQSIYKLAYANSTDQSSNSRSPSPMRPEDNIPCSYSQNEIIVHEAASDDDAGSEDVEMIPHRYESESYLNQLQNKNVYVNKLSLAVELLRTQENLPYDDEFKRIVGENNVEPAVHTATKYSFGFRKDSASPEKSSLVESVEKKRIYNVTNGSNITSQRQINPSPDRSSDSAIFSDTDYNSLENESSESAKEGTQEGANENQANTEGVRAAYRRIGLAQRRLSPLPFNPCFCCIIM